MNLQRVYNWSSMLIMLVFKATSRNQRLRQNIYDISEAYDIITLDDSKFQFKKKRIKHKQAPDIRSDIGLYSLNILNVKELIFCSIR